MSLSMQELVNSIPFVESGHHIVIIRLLFGRRSTCIEIEFRELDSNGKECCINYVYECRNVVLITCINYVYE